MTGMAGDQQAALFGRRFAPGKRRHLRHRPFLLVDTGEPRRAADARPVGTRHEAPAAYALEGAVFVAGAAVQWLATGWA